MKPFQFALATIALSALATGIIGCKETATTETPATTANVPESHDHDHPDHGPHGGDLIELGNEAYHAELVHGDGDEIAIYILGSDAKTAVPIDATELLINVTHEGTPEQFKLAASPTEGESDGKASRFVANDAELSEHVHDEGAKAKLVVVIDGKQFTGQIAHDHDHDHGHHH